MASIWYFDFLVPSVVEGTSRNFEGIWGATNGAKHLGTSFHLAIIHPIRWWSFLQTEPETRKVKYLQLANHSPGISVHLHPTFQEGWSCLGWAYLLSWNKQPGETRDSVLHIVNGEVLPWASHHFWKRALILTLELLRIADQAAVVVSWDLEAPVEFEGGVGSEVTGGPALWSCSHPFLREWFCPRD